MALVCTICAKGIMFGNSVSHANNKTKRVWKPNLQRIKTNLPGRKKRVYVCTRCIKAHPEIKAA